ncbi:DUF3137 domain-containing protein [Salinivibrio sp. KP-1]|uniref:DUF3137 domain-containing protein n=1 Tax=Salinivibrio sp. KP-1 TaxID=1406902 RepID=UPI00061454AD|nr:DUF3137 domain-containing protein [Salinivibrio sp. KP-1]KKA45571.1 hypothetical protein WN56_00020 [Salinivibrio sp. KP-1]
MRHNRKVSENIKELEAELNAAKSQEDLVTFIRKVESHPGPLDYDDRPIRVFLGAWVLLLIYTIFLFGAPAPFKLVFDLPYIDDVLQTVVFYSSAWVPATINCYLAKRLDKWTCKEFGLDKLLPNPDHRFAFAFLATFISMSISSKLQTAYWNFMSFIGSSFSSYRTSGELVGFFLFCAGVILFYWFFLRRRPNWRRYMSEHIMSMGTLFDNNLKDLRRACGIRYEQVASQFAEFGRGNDYRGLDSLYQGHYKGEVHEFDYQVYRFVYVIRKSETRNDSSGNTTSRDARCSYYRYGLLVPFPFAEDVTISGDGAVSGGGGEYKTASPAFNRQFIINANDELSAARFLSPAMVETLSDLNDIVEKPVLAVSNDNELCLAFDDGDILKTEWQYDLENPGAFADEITAHANLEKLNSLLAIIHETMKLTDSNFSGETAHFFPDYNVREVSFDDLDEIEKLTTMVR